MNEVLTATVVGVEHASQFTDDLPRVTLRIEEADDSFCRIRVPVRGELPELGAVFAFTRFPALAAECRELFQEQAP